MYQLIKCFGIATVAAVAFTVSAKAATPSEKLTSTLTRTAASGIQISDTLVKNIFRQEQVQVPYTVQESYTDTETYYETVPYQEEESYTDYEDYTDYEYRCEERSRDERVCRDVESCHIAPGEGPGGGPNRVCTTQPVCENVTRRYRECDNIPVRKTREVRKTRVVTRYREEARTRTVTRYRDKQVCCRTETRTVFDHQFKIPVIVNFPAETALVGNEQETFTVKFTGSEASPAVVLSPKDVLFGYAIQNQEFRGGAMVIGLKRVALYTQDQLGAASIKGLSLRLTTSGAEIRFNDQGLRPRVTSAYSYQIREAGAQDILAQGSLGAQGAQIVIPVQVTLIENKTYQVDVRVARQGLPLTANIDVVVSATQRISSLKDESIYGNKAMVNTFEIRGEKEEARLFFRDQSPNDEGVSTQYEIEILLGDKSSTKVIASKTIARENMIVTSKDFFRMMLGTDLGVSTQVLKDQVRVGKTVTARVTMTRQHIGLNNGAPVVFVLNHTAVIKKE